MKCTYMSDTETGVLSCNVENSDNLVINNLECSQYDNEKVNSPLNDSEKSLSNPYAYLEREGFTSELFKIEIRNLHPRVGFTQVKKKLINMNLNPHKIKILRKVTYVTFRSIEERDKAIKDLNQITWKGYLLAVKEAEGKADPFIQKRKQLNDESDTEQNKILKLDANPEETLKNTVTKLWRKPYYLQLKEKKISIYKFVKNLFTKLQKENSNLFKYLNENDNYKSFGLFKTDQGYIQCSVKDIVPSPVETHYRNKCEFTIGHDLQGRGPLLGFCYGKYRVGINAVGSPHCLNLLPERMEEGLNSLQSFLYSLSELDNDSESERRPILLPPLQAYKQESDSGHWRCATLRTSQSGELLVSIEAPVNLNQEQLEQLQNVYVDYFVNGPGKLCRPSSLYMTYRANFGDSIHNLQSKLLHGEKFITEVLNGVKFRISNSSFFQVNTLAAELLYNEIANQTCLDKETILLDVCSGTGTIGLVLAKFVEKVIGLEICEEAVEDAKQNALLNGIFNVEFEAGPAEVNLPKILAKLPKEKKVVAIVDPPRAGLHTNAIVALRKCEQIENIIYVSCSPQSAMQNFIDFGRVQSNKFQGSPLIPLRAIPVDLFPQTHHVELIIVFQRINSTLNK